MSTVTETFYGIRCDYRNCGEVFEGSEYSYWTDPGYASDEARESEWLIDFAGKDYCPSHCVLPTEFADVDDDEHYGIRPLPETWEAELGVLIAQRTETAHRRLDDVATNMRHKLGLRSSGYGSLNNLNRRLDAIFERTCLAWQPDLTSQQLFDLKNGRPSHLTGAVS